MLGIVEKAKLNIHEVISNYSQDPFGLWGHLDEVERWSRYLLKKNTPADKEIVLLSVWLHDIGYYPVNKSKDHAIVGEERARIFLENEGYNKNKLERVLHCVRAHRNNDVIPNSLEAKIICFCDSASHITSPDAMYLNIANKNKYYGKKYDVFSKMERDFRDLDFFPEIKKELLGFYKSWVKLIKEYYKLNLE